MGKPTTKQIEEYMAALNLPAEQGGTVEVGADYGLNKGLNGTASYDIVRKPKHYMLFDEMEIKERGFEGQGVEVRDVLEKLTWKLYQSGQCSEVPLFLSDYVQLMQYLMRFMDKNGKEDLEKARVYLNWMIEAYE